ncbi:hypothetical protein GSS88_06640 [Corynebacterium sp. 3HC-13]|uniref:hypothetical protein n=1 Tax=Corynebacterium poyangense TaxID=2684405 RepID=UPI001CCFF868|nr:hypothetical protein [Corynebacterium poyangense]MBZ8177472.1 hypothetical protein [Corynebacterium poyangense]
MLGKPDDDHFLMVNATSKVEVRLHHLGKTVDRFGLTAQDVSVHLQPGSHSFITKDTLIDCSKPFRLSTEDLIKAEVFALFDDPPSLEFFVPLLKAWAASPWAERAHLEKVRLRWSERGTTF